MATHLSILAWKIPWPEELAGYSSWGCKELAETEHVHTLVINSQQETRGLSGL